MKSSSKALISAAVLMGIAGCVKAQTSCCISGSTMIFSCSSCCSDCTPTVTIPDVKTAPDKLPAYGEWTLIWTGEVWGLAERTSSDATGEHWIIYTGVRGGASSGASKKHPMWQSLPSSPKDTPMCTATVDDKPKSWLPKGGMCRVEDAK